jgi:ABC-type Fe3+/spermidine/putrescine transport system ATPase subunit
MSSLLELDRVTKSFDTTHVLRDFSLTVSAGENLALVGPSGCGKTTLLRLIAGLDTPQAGRIVIEGRTATDGPRLLVPPHEHAVAMVFQDLALWPNLTARDNVVLWRWPPEVATRIKGGISVVHCATLVSFCAQDAPPAV